MASGDGTSDGLAREEHTRTKSVGKATQEKKTRAALESLPSPEKNQNPTSQNVAQNLTRLSKGKQALQDSEYGHDSIEPNEQSSTSWSIKSFEGGPGIFPSSDGERIIALGPSSSSKMKLIQALQETHTETDGYDPAESNLGGVAAIVAPVGATAVEPNVGSVVALLGEATSEPNGGPLVVLSDVGRAESNVGPIVVLYGATPAQFQSNAALIVAPLGEDLAQPNTARNVASRAPVVEASSIAPRRIAPVQPDGATLAQRNGAPPAPAQPNAALIVAPPAVVVLDVNHGLNRSRLKPLRICEIGSEGHFWPKLPRS